MQEILDIIDGSDYDELMHILRLVQHKAGRMQEFELFEDLAKLIRHQEEIDKIRTKNG